MDKQPYPLFIHACKDKIYGPNIWININNISSFEKHIKILPSEQWYLIITTNNQAYYTMYDMNTLSVFNMAL